MLAIRTALRAIVAATYFTATAVHGADAMVAATANNNADLPVESEQGAPPEPPPLTTNPPPSTPSQNVTINLINRLVQRGVLTREDAAELIKQAEADTEAARLQARADAQAAVAEVAAQFASGPASPPPPDESDVRVTYIPEYVKAQIRDEVMRDLALTDAEGGKSVAVERVELPGWVKKFRVFGDVRVRYEGAYFPEGNDTTGAFPNFNAINTGAPFDVSGVIFSPQLNVDEDRRRIRLRLRVGAEVDLGEGFSIGMRIATGENNSPVSTNQSFGLSNQGQGGNFSKYAIWLDRGFIKYEIGELNRQLSASVGRFENPFFSSEILWDDDIGFDGAAIKARYEVGHGVTPFLAVGAFPVFNTDFNFSSNQPDKFPSDDKYLYGAQLGAGWKGIKDIETKFAAAYYYFDNIEGRLSDPFTPLNTSDAGNTDNTRPSFAQKGNTYMALRNIEANALNNFGTINQFQYFGLATPFENFALTGRIDFNHFEPVQVSITGEYVKNIAFEQEAINAKAVNNRGPTDAAGDIGQFEGGDTAWIIGLRVGTVAMQKRWDWALGLNYRYVESDAVVDGFTDSDFGLGGTNLEGYTVSGAVALSSNISLGIRWMSANSIAGPPFKADVLQVDLNGKF
jgi:hypothetical protein